MAEGSNVLDKARCLPDANWQYARRRRVERSGMTDAFCSGNAAHESHRIVARHAGRLQKVDNTVHRGDFS